MCDSAGEGVSDVDEKLLEAVMEKCGGNPLLCHVIVVDLLNSAAITIQNHKLEVKNMHMYVLFLV